MAVGKWRPLAVFCVVVVLIGNTYNLLLCGWVSFHSMVKKGSNKCSSFQRLSVSVRILRISLAQTQRLTKHNLSVYLWLLVSMLLPISDYGILCHLTTDLLHDCRSCFIRGLNLPTLPHYCPVTATTHSLQQTFITDWLKFVFRLSFCSITFDRHDVISCFYLFWCAANLWAGDLISFAITCVSSNSVFDTVHLEENE